MVGTDRQGVVWQLRNKFDFPLSFSDWNHRGVCNSKCFPAGGKHSVLLKCDTIPLY